MLAWSVPALRSDIHNEILALSWPELEHHYYFLYELSMYADEHVAVEQGVVNMKRIRFLRGEDISQMLDLNAWDCAWEVLLAAYRDTVDGKDRLSVVISGEISFVPHRMNVDRGGEEEAFVVEWRRGQARS